ncbi:hypothetical protein [Helicobacter sp. 11S03491-1]|uniref:hypothetical protein n=1 Tax=Helicobacter sp. 11S03491-1 TaxID=1476196 RepID=UPI000BA793B8|nr:hypothetical protein [Helicobacter sp. 11S03491-1]PAF43457.1 hypothetical protein BKH45_02185 [Helicobacter sp. 11S03491-1]
MLKPIVEKLHSQQHTINILTDTPSFEFKKLGLEGKNIYQTFGQLLGEMISLEEFMKKSHSKNQAFFIPKDIIVLSKQSVFFNPKDQAMKEELSDTLACIQALQNNQYGYKKAIESKDFVIYVKSPYKDKQ